MATQTLLDYSHFASSPNLASRHKPSSPALSTLAGESPDLAASHARHLSLSGPFIPASSIAPSTHGKLHRKSQHRKAVSLDHHASTHSLSFEPVRRSTDTPPIAEHLSVATTSADPPRKSSRSAKLRRNFKRLSQTSIDEPAAIDLSKTTEENEARSGIAISHSSPRLSDVQFVRVRGHGRNMSNTSNQSAVSGSFTPSLPYTHPLRQQQDASSAEPMFAGVSNANDRGSIRGLGIDTELTDSRRSFGDARHASTTSLHLNKPHRRSLRMAEAEPQDLTADHDPFHHTTSQSVNPYAYTSPLSTSARPSRSRRGTTTSQRSVDNTATPHSNRTSFTIERAASYIRSPSLVHCSSNDMDSAELGAERERERTATIQAARRAFDERQDAKARKYEDKERKAAERRDRKAARAEDRRRRRNSEADNPGEHRPVVHQRSYSGGSRPRTRQRASTLPPDFEIESGHDAYANISDESDIAEEQDGWDSSAVDSPAESGLGGRKSTSKTSDHLDSGSVSSAAGMDPKISRKRHAKGGYFGFTTWFKTRMLHLSKGTARAE